MSKLLSRKFILGAMALVFGFILGALGKLTGDYAVIASVAMGAFSAADAVITHKSLSVGSTINREGSSEEVS